METFVYGTMNNATKNADKTKVDSLGPYAQAMFLIVGSSMRRRTDINK
jgi:hypothetical protein